MSDTPNDPPPACPWPCRTRRLTPGEVLTHLRAFCTEMMGLQPEWVGNRVMPDVSVRTLHELEPEFDWIDFPSYFGLDLDQTWWNEWATPDRTVSELCLDLAGRVEVPVFEPVKMLGRECETAGAFLAIRNMLAANGADVRKLGPSSPMAPYLRRHRAMFGRVRLASGGRLPHVEVTHPYAGVILAAIVLGGVAYIITAVLRMCGVEWVAALLLALVAGLTVALGFAIFSRSRSSDYPADFRQLVFTLLGRKPRTA